jgi:hypothetical protein
MKDKRILLGVAGEYFALNWAYAQSRELVNGK